MNAGTLSPSVQVAVSGSNGFSGIVNVSASLPNGISCVSSACSGKLATGSSLTFQYASISTLAAGDYTITFTGASGNLSHKANVSVTVNSAPPVPPNHSGMVFTGDFLPPSGGVVYDKKRDHIYVANLQLSEVDVINPESLKIINRIPVPSPTNLDMTPDDATLYVGTSTQNLFAISTASLSVRARIPFPESAYPNWVTAMADGTVAVVSGCGTINACGRGGSLLVYSPATGQWSYPNLNGQQSAPTYSPLAVPSADRTKLFFCANSAMYETATGQAVTSPFNCNFLAARPDGKGYAMLNYNTENTVEFYDDNYNLLGTYQDPTTDKILGVVYSSDSSKLFMADTNYNLFPSIDVADSNSFQYLGQIPSEYSPEYGFRFYGVDGQNRLMGFDNDLLVLIDASMTPTTLPSTYPRGAIGGENVSMSPDNPSSGLNTTFNASGFTDAPLVTFNGTPATNIEVTPSGVAMTAPALGNVAQADVNLYFPSGYFLLAPDAYSYKPTVLYADGDASGTTGGSTLTLYGFGFGSFSGNQVSVKIGGTEATDIKTTGGFISPFAVPLNLMTATVPPGTAGTYDITVTTPAGSTIVPRGFTYAQRDDFLLPSTASPFQMILDKPRDRLLWTDSAANQLIVYSISSNQIEQQINVGNQPAGLALSTDGSKLLVALYGDDALKVYDADKLSFQQKISMPAGSGSGPVFISAVANQNAFILSTVPGFSDVPVYEYDIAANRLKQRTDVIADESSFEAASADGRVAIVGFGVWNAVTDTFTAASFAEDSSRALSADGAIISEYRAWYGNDGNVNGVAGLQTVLNDELAFNSIPGNTLDATGALAYLPEVDRIRIIDIRHGKLIKTLMVPDGLSATTVEGMVTDPDGQTLYVLTQNGVTTFTFTNDPLSIGEVQAVGDQITILGSGFTSGITASVDGSAVPATLIDSQHLSLTLASVPAGALKITLSLPTGETYSLDNTLDISGTTAASTPLNSIAIHAAKLPDTTHTKARGNTRSARISRLFELRARSGANAPQSR